MQPIDTENMQTTEEIINVVTKFFATNNFTYGDGWLAKHAEELPDNIKLECLGNRYFYKREFQESITCYEEAITLAPARIISRYQYLVGTIEEQQGDFVAAFERYQMAIDSEPTFIDSYVELGGLLVKAEDFTGALQCYRDAARLDSSNPINLYNLKAVLEKMIEIEPHQYEEELRTIDQAYELLVPNHPMPPLSKYQW
jgi:tetratricopeptide (TPR) repeat protein